MASNGGASSGGMSQGYGDNPAADGEDDGQQILNQDQVHNMALVDNENANTSRANFDYDDERRYENDENDYPRQDQDLPHMGVPHNGLAGPPNEESAQ